jgi:methylmalonyl-CoA/ethylmalonyl-CoA epimerase
MNRPHIDHIGIIVENLEKSMGLFVSVFGFKPSQIKEMNDVGLKIATLKADNIDIELIQYMAGEHQFGKTVMGETPGINHIAVSENNINLAVKDFKTKGVKIMEGFPRKGSHGQVAFFERTTTENILLEICSKI